MFTRKNNNKGFTLIELMIVVVIIGILAALAIPRFMTASTRSKQSEAQQILKQIYTMEHTYRQANGEYNAVGSPVAAMTTPGTGGGSFSDIGVEVQVNNRYAYTITANTDDFVAEARANLDDDATEDVWQIDETGFLQCTSNDATS